MHLPHAVPRSGPRPSAPGWSTASPVSLRQGPWAGPVSIHGHSKLWIWDPLQRAPPVASEV